MRGHPWHLTPEVLRRIIKAARARQQLTNKAVAVRLGISESVVKNRIHEARCEGKL